MSRKSTDRSVALGARLRELRRAARLSQQEVARRMGSSFKVVSRLEKGGMVRPGLALVADYLEAVGAGFSDIADASGQGVRTEGRGVRTEERGVRIEERGVRTEERGVRTEERGVRTEERGVRTEERGVRTEERGVRTEGRGVRTEERGVRTEERGVRTEGRGVRTEERGTRKEADRAKPKPVKTTARRLRDVERRARRLFIARMFEGMLYELFTSGALAADDDERAALARHAREVFRLLEKHQFALDRRRRAARAAPGKVTRVEEYTRMVFDQMWRAGDFERRPDVDAAAVLAGNARLTRVWRVEDRLHREEELRFLGWGRERNRVFQRIWGEGMELLRGRGTREPRLARLSSVISELCGLAADTGPGSKQRKARQRELGRRLKDRELAGALCELVFRRWDELKHLVPPETGRESK